jgi:Na+-driven multidrug efflux pump
LQKILQFSYRFETGTGLLLALILALTARPMIGLFIKDPVIVETGIPMLRMQLVGMPFIAVVLVTTCIFQSAGKAWNAFLLSVSRQGVLFAVVILLAARLAGYYGVLMAQAVSDLLTALLAVWLFWRGLYRVIWEK